MVKKDEKIEEEMPIKASSNPVDEVDAYLKDVKEKSNTLDKEVWQPEEAAKQKANQKAFKKIIRTKNELLKVFDPKKGLMIKVEHKDMLLEFKVKPLTNSKELEDLSLDQRPYMDIDEVKNKLNSKKKNKGKKVKDSVEEERKPDDLKILHMFLITYLSPPLYDKDKDGKEVLEECLDFWGIVPIKLKKELLAKTLEAWGLDIEADLKLFPVH